MNATIMERCVELCVGLERVHQAKENLAQARGLETRREELEKVRDELAELVKSVRVLHNHDQLEKSALPVCSKALESCDKVEALLDKGSIAITKGRDYTTFLARLAKVRDNLRVLVENSWQTVLSRHKSVDEAFLRRVEVFPGQAQIVEKIRNLRKEYDQATKVVPGSEDDYKRFENCYSAFQQELARLDPSEFPDDVLRFFRSAQQVTGAPVSLFTENVRDWLSEKGLLDGVRIRFTGEN